VNIPASIAVDPEMKEIMKNACNQLHISSSEVFPLGDVAANEMTKIAFGPSDDKEGQGDNGWGK
jgi:hypothetical protein